MSVPLKLISIKSYFSRDLIAEENKETETTEDENVVRKTISIKGVSADLYRRIQKISNDTGKTIGQEDCIYRRYQAGSGNARVC